MPVGFLVSIHRARKRCILIIPGCLLKSLGSRFVCKDGLEIRHRLHSIVGDPYISFDIDFSESISVRISLAYASGTNGLVSFEELIESRLLPNL